MLKSKETYSHTSNASSTKKKKIMIVDDDSSILEIAKIVLEDEGYETATYTSGSHLYRLSTDLPDLILLDVLLSGEDGREICTFLKMRENTKHIPIILFSAHAKGELGRIFDTTCAPDYFIPKPFDIYTLSSVVKKLLNASQN
jgi:CheY-like chemotaxis protein